MSKEIQIRTLGGRVQMNVDNIPATLSSWYPINSNFNIVKTGIGYGEPYDKIDYVVRDTENNTSSNISSIIINYPPNKNIRPDVAITDVNLTNNEEETNLFDYLQPNSAVDRIRITSFSTIGNFTYNGTNLYPGEIIMIYDLDKIKFKSYLGQGMPYSFLKFQVGNSLQYSSEKTININKIDTASLGEPTTNIFESTSFSVIKISGGIPLKNANLKIIIETNSLKYFNSNYNVSVSLNGVEVLRKGEFNLSVQLNENGQYSFPIEINSDSPIADGDITFAVELLSLDINNTNVALNNRKTITINL
jgi:hypothetical protein